MIGSMGSGKISSIDLHGVRHRDVYKAIESFLMKNDWTLPFEIITGNSADMRKEVVEVLRELGLAGSVKDNHNWGVMVVTDPDSFGHE
jgi:hypothetical protein